MRFFGVSSMLQIVRNRSVHLTVLYLRRYKLVCVMEIYPLEVTIDYSPCYIHKNIFSSIQHNCTYTDVNFKNAVVGSCVKDKTTSNLMPPLPGGIWRPFLVWE